MHTVSPQGVPVPALGFGTARFDSNDRCRRAVETALHVGYRHVDIAQMNSTDPAVGAAIENAAVDRREDLHEADPDEGLRELPAVHGRLLRRTPVACRRPPDRGPRRPRRDVRRTGDGRPPALRPPLQRPGRGRQRPGRPDRRARRSGNFPRYSMDSPGARRTRPNDSPSRTSSPRTACRTAPCFSPARPSWRSCGSSCCRPPCSGRRSSPNKPSPRRFHDRVIVDRNARYTNGGAGRDGHT